LIQVSLRARDKQKIMASIIAILAVFAVVQNFPSKVQGASTGTVCIVQVTDTKCPASPPVFNGPLTTPNTLLRVPVMVNNTAPFLGFDITLNSSNLSQLRPYGADLTGSLMPPGSITLVECVGTVKITGSSCTVTDNPSSIHLAVVGPFGFLSTQGATGLLFTAIFSIAGTTLPGEVTIGYQSGCSQTSSGNLCVTLTNGTVVPVTESTRGGFFDDSNTATLPYATVTTPATNLGLSLAGAPSHALPTVTFTATSQNGFNTTSTTTLNLAAIINGTGIRPTLLLSVPSVDLALVSAQTFTESGTVTSTVPAGVYIATVTATYQAQDLTTFTTSSLSATFSLLIIVTDYSLTVSPNPVSILVPGSKPVTAAVVPKAGFNSLVKLGVSIPPASTSAGIGATLSPSTISGGAGTSTLTITTTANTPAGTFTLTVSSNSTLNGFTKIHSISIFMMVGSVSSPDFQINANPSTIFATPGILGSSTVTAIALNGFAGNVSLRLSLIPTTGLVCSLTRTLLLGGSNFTGSLLSCSSPIGSYNITVTGNSGTHTHSIFVSFIVQTSPRTVIAVDPFATVDLARTSKTITIAINVTGSPAINAVDVVLAFDTHVLHASSLNFSTNVLAQSIYPTFIVRDCLDGLPANNGPSGLCGQDDGPGIVSFAESILGGNTSNNTQGNIFFLTFSVNTTAPVFSQIQIRQATLGLGGTSIPVKTIDGYYTSRSCAGVPCTPPSINFSWTPLTPIANQVVNFDASASRASPNAVITDYRWLFDDPFGLVPVRDGGSNSTTSYLFTHSGRYSVTLTITDSDGLRWSKTLIVAVVPPLPPKDFTLSGPVSVVINPGQQFTYDSIRVTSFNLTSTVTLSAISPQGLTVAFNPTVLNLTPASSAFSLLTITASSTIPPGNYQVIIIGTAGVISHNETEFVNVLAPNFVLSASPGLVTISSGSSATIMVALYGNLNTTIRLSSPESPGSSLPNSAFNVSFTPSSFAIYPRVQFFLSSMTIRPYAGTPPGNYLVYVVGSNGFMTRFDFVSVTVTGPPDFTIQTYPPTVQVLAGSTGFLAVNVQRSPCCTGLLPPFNVTLTVTISPLVPNGPQVSLRDAILTIYGGSYTSVIILTGPNTTPGNYTVTVTGRSGPFSHSASSTLIVLPPPVLRVTPSSGPVGTEVQINGSGFISSQPGYPQSHVFWVTFDSQFLGEAFTSSSSFVFTFDVPDAQPGAHLVKALDFSTGVNATAPFEVLATPGALAVTIDTGSIYFPGDTATVYVLISQNGLAVQSSSLQIHLTLIKPDGSNVSLTVIGVSGGLFKAVYTVPTTGPIGTYALLATAQGPDSAHGTALHTFEVKPSWLSSKGQALVSTTGAIGAIGLVALAWKKGYLKRKQGDQEIFA